MAAWQIRQDRAAVAGLAGSWRLAGLGIQQPDMAMTDNSVETRIAVVAVALLLLTLTGGIVATTIEAQRANRRFNDVRRLAHSVMFEYHDQIAALPGSTPVRERLVKDSLEYLANLSQEAGNDRALMRELAAAYEKVSSVQAGAAASEQGAAISFSNLSDTRGAIASISKRWNYAKNWQRWNLTIVISGKSWRTVMLDLADYTCLLDLQTKQLNICGEV